MDSNSPFVKVFCSEKSIFFQNILHFILSTHLIPLREYSSSFLSDKADYNVTLKTNFNDDITFKLNELPSPSSKDFLQLSARILINGCYEILKESPLKEKVNSEVFEFFRHIRNASSHNGQFIFKGSEPKAKAKWRKFEITKTLNGTNLFDFIAIGDTVILLEDISEDIG